MKKAALLLLIFTSLFFTSCEEVVNVDLDTAPSKLVVEAAIYWKKGTAGNIQTIKLTTTTSYYNQEIPVVSGAVIFIKNSKNQQFNFTEVPKTGRYVCNNFVPVLNEIYTLTIINGSYTYTASEILKSVAPITRLEQNNQGGFTGEDIEVKAFFSDPVDQDNYYLFHYIYSNQVKSNYYADEDKFFQGNEFFSKSDDDDLKIGDQIEVAHIGISKAYFNYMSILVSVASSNGGGPFQSPPATVRGNIINTTNSTDYPLGYFSLSETDSKKYTIQ